MPAKERESTQGEPSPSSSTFFNLRPSLLVPPSAQPPFFPTQKNEKHPGQAADYDGAPRGGLPRALPRLVRRRDAPGDDRRAPWRRRRGNMQTATAATARGPPTAAAALPLRPPPMARALPTAQREEKRERQLEQIPLEQLQQPEQQQQQQLLRPPPLLPSPPSPSRRR